MLTLFRGESEHGFSWSSRECSHVAVEDLLRQEAPRDVWDYDAISNVVLLDTADHRQTVPATGDAGNTE